MLNYFKRFLILISIIQLTNFTVIAMQDPIIEPNRTYALKSIFGKGWLDGKGKHGEKVDVADSKRIPIGDKFLQWVITRLENGNYVLKSVASDSYLNGRTKEGNPVLVGNMKNLNKGGSLDQQKALQWQITRLKSGNYALEHVHKKSLNDKTYLNSKDSKEKIINCTKRGMRISINIGGYGGVTYERRPTVYKKRVWVGQKVEVTTGNPEKSKHLQWEIIKLKI